MLKKTIRFNVYPDPGTLLIHREFMNLPNRLLCLAAACPEGREVVPTFKADRCGTHSLHVKAFIGPGNTLGEIGRPHITTEQDISIFS